MSTTATAISEETKLAIVRHLANGKTPGVVATIVHADEDTVKNIAKGHGYPDPGKLHWAADIMAKRLEQGDPIPQSEHREAAPRVRNIVEEPAPTPAPLGKPDEIRVLLNTAKAHPVKRVQNAANKVFDDLDRLRGLIREDEEKNAAKRKAAAEKAAAKAEVERLQEQLRAAKAKLKGSTATAPKRTVNLPHGDYPCRSGCDRNFDTPQGRSAHERRAHEGFDPKAAKAS